MTRPELQPVALVDWPPFPGVLAVTMAPGQWDELLEAAYAEGAILLEVDGGRLVAAYQRATANARPTS